MHFTGAILTLWLVLAWTAHAQELGETIFEFPNRDDLGDVSALTTSADGKMLVAIANRDPAIIYGCEPSTQQIKYRVEVPESYHGVTGVAWAGKEKLLIICSDWHKHSIREFDVETGKLSTWRLPFAELGEGKDVGAPSWIRASADGKRFVIGLTTADNSGGLVRVYDTFTKTVLSQFEPHRPFDDAPAILAGLFDLDISADGQRVVTSGSDRKTTGAVKLWNAETGKVLSQLKLPYASQQRVTFSAKGDSVVTAGPYQDTTVRKFNIQVWPIGADGALPGEAAQEVVLSDGANGARLPSYWSGGYNKLFELSRDGNTAIVACPYFFRACSLTSGRIAMRLGEGDTSFPDNGVTLSADGRSIWLGTDDSTITRYSLPDVSGKLKLRK